MMEIQFNIIDLFFQSAQKYPDKVAIIDGDKQITFSELEQSVKSTSAYFIKKGIVKNDRVMLFAPMSIDLYRIVLALFNIGATAVFLDEWVSKKRMEECCKIAQCKAFIGVLKARIFAFFSSELRKIPVKLGVSTPATILINDSKTKVYKSDTALITFTTGTTGVPKAAKRTHGFLYEQFDALLEKIEPVPEDVDMPVLPIVLLINLGAGCTSIIAPFKMSKPELMDAKKVLTQINKFKVNRLTASPYCIKQLSNCIINNPDLLPAGLKKIFTGGAPVFPAEAELYSRAFPQAQIEIVYGSTEAEPISSINAKKLIKEGQTILQNGLAVGIPHNKAEVKIIKITEEPILISDSEEFKKNLLPTETIGEIIVSGPHILREYFNNENALKQNKIFIKDKCWHRTGDSGYISKDGELYLTGRCNTLIYSGNTIISPFIYENYFQSVKGVETGTIMQINNRLVAIIELKKNTHKKNVLKELQKPEMRLDEIKIISKVPRDPRHNSKIDYEKLKRLYFK
jgi:olefin beta-lactone synthetase